MKSVEADVVEKLVEGDESFRNDVDVPLLAYATSGQTPSVTTLSFSDSRVAPERILGFSIGDAIVVRFGNDSWSDVTVLGSIEYAVDHPNVRAIMVLGDTDCGVVAAAVAGVRLGNMFGAMMDIERASIMVRSGHLEEGDAIAESDFRLKLRVVQDNSSVIMASPIAGQSDADRCAVRRCNWDSEYSERDAWPRASSLTLRELGDE